MAHGNFQIQVGAYPTAAQAERQVASVQRSMAGRLAAYAPLTLPVMVRGQQYWRVRFDGFESANATQTCNELRRNHIDCFVAKAR